MSGGKRILIFTGDGKGKTTAALGMALRASGHGMRICVIQFVKNDPSTGEMAAIEELPNVDIIQMGLGFVPSPENERFAEHQAAAQAALRKAREAIASKEYDLVVLDEACFAVSRGLLNEKQVLDVLEDCPPQMCLVLTGCGATEKLVTAADTVTEMRNIKHAIESGRCGQKGVEI